MYDRERNIMIDNAGITHYDIICKINDKEKVVGTCVTEADAREFYTNIQGNYELARCMAVQCTDILLPEAVFMIRAKEPSVF